MIEFQSIRVPDPCGKREQLEETALVLAALRKLVEQPSERGFSVRLTKDLDGTPRLSVIPYSSLQPTKGSPWNA